MKSGIRRKYIYKFKLMMNIAQKSIKIVLNYHVEMWKFFIIKIQNQGTKYNLSVELARSFNNCNVLVQDHIVSRRKRLGTFVVDTVDRDMLAFVGKLASNIED